MEISGSYFQGKAQKRRCFLGKRGKHELPEGKLAWFRSLSTFTAVDLLQLPFSLLNCRHISIQFDCPSIDCAIMSQDKMCDEEAQHPELRGLYYIHEEIGCGGFGKVKLATHLLTDAKVAIKIIDKKAIGDDLPRVSSELDALRNLSHQNICRLYQYIESGDKFFIVMEYCSGGEMFDYIVKKDRLEEPEARHFFRQLCQAMAYVHNKGYAHRDLKPENLLLTDDLQLRVIDFGLCAKPGLLTNMLTTCCGSPAYAAPELISGSDYHGDKADIWSMGVLLYALVCGALPFEDDNNANLFRKIQNGRFYKPPFLSDKVRDLLSRMLTVNPEARIKMAEVIEHPWVKDNYTQPLKWSSIYDRSFVDKDVATELAYYHQLSVKNMIEKIMEWRFDYLTASYYLLLQKKRRGEKFNLPAPLHTAKGEVNLISSPTVHASLECNLDRSGIDDNESSGLSSESDASREREVHFSRPLSPERKISYVNAMLNMPTMCGRSPQQRLESPSTPVRVYPVVRRKTANAYDANKENRSSQSVRIRGPVKVQGDGTIRPHSAYQTPQRPILKSLFSPSSGKSRRSQSIDRAASPASLESESGSDCMGRTPRSTTKTPRLRQRVFASLERKKEKVINLLTPRKLNRDSPTTLKTCKGLINVSMTSSKDPARVKQELINILVKQEMEYSINGWKMAAWKKTGVNQMHVELEVVMVENLGLIGIRRKRLAGDAFLYKKVCEQILLMAGL